MAHLDRLDLDRPSPSGLWAVMEPEERREAARQLYAGDNREHKLEADMAIATHLKFRPAAVRKLPVERRADYVARSFRPDDSLAISLLLALHLGERRDLLTTFLDTLEIPHEGGMIDEDFDLTAPQPERMAAAVAALEDRHPADRVGLYLAALLAVDPEIWSGVRDHLSRIG